MTAHAAKVFASIFGLAGEGRREIRWKEFVQVRCGDGFVLYRRAEDAIGVESRRHCLSPKWQARGIRANIHSDDDQGDGDYAAGRGKRCLNCGSASRLMSLKPHDRKLSKKAQSA